ncbi:Gfo/Idh/MocA family oxidoreductase, partial [Streptococcus suis]
HRFIVAAHLSGHYQLHAVLSRRLENSAAFSDQYEGVDLYTELVKFLSAPIEVVYIASPNALHFEQAKSVLAAGKQSIF